MIRNNRPDRHVVTRFAVHQLHTIIDSARNQVLAIHASASNAAEIVIYIMLRLAPWCRLFYT